MPFGGASPVTTCRCSIAWNATETVNPNAVKAAKRSSTASTSRSACHVNAVKLEKAIKAQNEVGDYNDKLCFPCARARAIKELAILPGVLNSIVSGYDDDGDEESEENPAKRRRLQ